MKVAVCGTNHFELLNKVTKHYNVEYIDVVGGPHETYNIYDVAKATYDYDDVKNVVFNGSVLDFASNDIHALDEQILLCALSNLDIVYVYTPDMTEEEVNKYHMYDGYFKGQIVDVKNVDTLIIY